ncbi:MAG: hypothetical protein IPK08_16440 [Bacteroidetes bacterium]|nr:hypothetical protein [Bacteroidota bacterium]
MDSSNSSIVLLDFNRCNGDFSNPRTIKLSDSKYLFGNSFSSDSKYIYACTSTRIFQIDTDNLNVDTVAVYDGFIWRSMLEPFWNMYLAPTVKFM